MDIKGIKLPKLRKILSQLIKDSPNISRGKEDAFLKIVNGNGTKRGANKPKLIELYNNITNSKKTETMTIKKFKQDIELIRNPMPVSQRHGSITITKQNIERYNKFVPRFYYTRANHMVSKNPNSIYKFKFRYYRADGSEVKHYKDSVKSWDYTFTSVNKKVISDMLIQTRTQMEPYEWHPYLFLEGNPHGKVIFTAESYPKVGNIKKQIARIQTYKNNLTNTCVYDGCVQYFLNKINRNEKDLKAKTAYNKLIKSKLQYATEYTDKTLHQIGQLVKASIIIKDFVNGEDQEFNIDEFNRYRIEFMNTRYNHLELCTASFGEPIEVDTIEDLQRVKDESKYYIAKFGKVYTSDTVYKVKDTDFKTVFNKWSNDVELNKYSISDKSEGYKFLENYDYVIHRFINDMPIDNSLYKELDLRKAYYNYSDKEFNPFYVGVPSGAFITAHCNSTFDYNKMSKKIVGFYEVKIVSIKNKKLVDRVVSVGEKYVFFTSMINLLLEHCELKFLNACYCPSVDIPFTKDFLNVENGLSHYCKAVGVFQHVSNTIDTTIKVLDNDVRYYSIINQPNCSYYKENNLIHISRENLDVQSYHHIALAIHSYNHTLVLNEMLKYNIDDIFGVKLDSIVIKKEVKTIDNPSFKVKEGHIESLLKNWGCITEMEKKPSTIVEELNKFNAYLESHPTKINKVDTSSLDEGIAMDKNDFSHELENMADELTLSDIITPYFKPSENSPEWHDYFLNTKEYVYEPVVVVGGGGGSGKTSSLLGHFDPFITCYTTTCWNLIAGMKAKHPHIIGLSIPKLTGELDGKTVEQCYKPKIKIIIQDEATLLDYKKDTKQIIKMYPHCFHFILGDVDFDGSYYQCSMMNSVINPSKIRCQYVKYIKTYRFDTELNANLNELRGKMTELKGNTQRLHAWFKQSAFKSRVFDIDAIAYGDADVGISCTNEMGDKSKHLTERFIARGAKPKYFIKTTYLHKKQMKGQELDKMPTDHSNFEMKLFKTIHSFQGLELTQDNNIIIDLSCIFDYNLLYTAMSRARRMEQIYIIKTE